METAKNPETEAIVDGNSVCKMTDILSHWEENGLLNKCYKWISIWRKIKMAPSPTSKATYIPNGSDI